MNFINLTPHFIKYAAASEFINLEQKGSIYIADSLLPAKVFTIASTGQARVSISTVEIESLPVPESFDSIKMFKTEYGELTGIPETVADDDLLVVSLMFQSAAKAANHPLANQMIVVYGVVRDRANTSNELGCQGFS